MIPNVIMSELLSTKEAAEYLNMKLTMIRRKAQSGAIPSIRISNRLYFDKCELDNWLQQRTNERLPHILVIVDDPVIGDLIKNTLVLGRYQVTTVLSSLEALEIIKQKQFTIIFLDLALPEVDGVELFRHIRKINEDALVIILTGSPDSKVMAKAMEYSPFLVLKKPFTINEILLAVHNKL